MPMTSHKNGGAAPIGSRKQSILGAARVIAEPPAVPKTYSRKGVPMPKPANKPGTTYEEIIGQLVSVGDFVLVQNDEHFPDIASSLQAVRAMHDRARRRGKRIACRRDFEVDGKAGMGVWLVGFHDDAE